MTATDDTGVENPKVKPPRQSAAGVPARSAGAPSIEVSGASKWQRARAAAVELAAQGATVAAAARRAERLGELPDVVPLPCDVTSPAAADAMVDAAVRRLGGLDALVYAAGLSRINPLHEAGFDDWVELFAPNVFGAAIVTRAALAHLLANGSQGRAVFLTSDSAEKPYPGLVLYSSAKAALSAYAQGLASEFPALKVTEVVVGPTAGTEVASHFDPEAFGVWATRWFEEGYVRYEMLQVADVVPMWTPSRPTPRRRNCVPPAPRRRPWRRLCTRSLALLHAPEADRIATRADPLAVTPPDQTPARAVAHPAASRWSTRALGRMLRSRSMIPNWTS